ncbi:TPA: hypothetical protein U1W74_002011 [Streptococcus suis]|nr:hypothetical protein [Streptococcus suis]HEM4177577.1 hypothetical protein [Streptococcus suis]
MKKIIPFFILIITFLGVAIYLSLESDKTDVEIAKSWTVTGKEINTIEIYGSEQPFELEIVETDQEVTTISLTGKISEVAMSTLEKADISENDAYIPLGKKGFKLVTVASGKSSLKAKIELAKGATFKEIYVDTWNGTVDITLPRSYDGGFDVKLNSGAKLLEVPEEGANKESILKIDAYADVSIRKGD